MKFEYDAEVDALYIRLTESPVANTEETDPGCMIDYDESRQVVGIEILRASEKLHGMRSAFGKYTGREEAGRSKDDRAA